jgi:hypothetical protein
MDAKVRLAGSNLFFRKVPTCSDWAGKNTFSSVHVDDN